MATGLYLVVLQRERGANNLHPRRIYFLGKAEIYGSDLLRTVLTPSIPHDRRLVIALLPLCTLDLSFVLAAKLNLQHGKYLPLIPLQSLILCCLYKP
jgi:hypothetical protein